MNKFFNVNVIVKIFILMIFFIAFLGILNSVKGAETLIVGQSKMINGYSENGTSSDLGIESKWGKISSISITGKNPNAISAEIVKDGNGTSLSNNKGLGIRVKALKAGECTLTIKYDKSFWDKSYTKTFNYKVIAKTISKIAIVNNPYKTQYNPNEKIDTKGILILGEYNDKSDAGSIVNYTISPEKAPNKPGETVKVTVTAKGSNAKATFDIRIKGQKINTNTENEANINNENKVNTNINNMNIVTNTTNIDNTANKTEVVYTEKLKKGQILKFNATSWYLYNTKVMDKNNPAGYLKNSDKVEIKEINYNWLKVKVISSSSLNNKECFMYYGSTAKNYFSIDKDVNVENNINQNSQTSFEMDQFNINAETIEGITNSILKYIIDILTVILAQVQS